MTGNEHFTLNKKAINLTLLDFWQYHYSDLFNISEYIAEFLVAKALGIDTPYNCESWTLYDIPYKSLRIEVKMTAYYHPELDKISENRRFSIKPVKGDGEVEERQNDVYVFCLSTGRDRESANPLDLDQWEFYIVPTSVINANCGDQKSIGLSKVVEYSGGKTEWVDIKKRIDELC